MHTAWVNGVCVSRDGLLTCLGCIPASRFFNFHFNIFLDQVSFLAIPLSWLVFWAFTQGDLLLRWKPKQQGEPRWRLWYEKSKQHLVLKRCHYRGRMRDTIQQTGDWFTRRQPDWCLCRILHLQGCYHVKVKPLEYLYQWGVDLITGKHSTKMSKTFHLKM